MGYFVVSEPNPMWCSVFWKRKAAKLPLLPTLSTILKAGEAQIYTSAMFDWVEMSSGGDAVGWRSFYEAFFNQLAWLGTTDNPKYPRAATQALNVARRETKSSLKRTNEVPKLYDWHVEHRRYARNIN